MFIVFFGLWLIFNGRITLEIVWIGALLSGILYLYCIKFLALSPRKEWRAIRRLPRILAFVVRLVVEIVKANMSVMRLIYSPRYEAEPRLVSFRTRLKEPALRVMLANAITLTPGTITALLEDDRLTVHCLDKDFAEGLDDTIFERDLLKMEGEKHDA